MHEQLLGLIQSFCNHDSSSCSSSYSGPLCKMRDIKLPYLASCGIVLSERNKRAKVFQGANTAQQPRWTTHCTTTKVHTLHVNCLKVQSGRAARKNRTKNTSLQRESTFKREKRYEILLMFKRENWRKFFRLNQLFHHHQYFPKHCILCPSWVLLTRSRLCWRQHKSRNQHKIHLQFFSHCCSAARFLIATFNPLRSFHRHGICPKFYTAGFSG